MKEKRTIDGPAYVTYLCDRIESLDRSVHSFLPEENRGTRLLGEITQLLQRQDRENIPLWEVPVGVKDIIRVTGLPTRAGSKIPSDEFDGTEATIITKLKQAGCIILGKTVTTEFAYAEPGETVNPVNHKYSPGGSSSGSAAAIATGICPLAIGSQTIGSTLRPASYCGVVGLKGSFRRVDTAGMIPFAPSLDTVGLFAKQVTDLFPVTQVLFDDWQMITQPLQQPTFAIPVGKFLNQANTDVLAVFTSTVSQLRQNGCVVKEMPLFDEIKQINEEIWTLAAVEMAQVQKPWYGKYKDLYRPKTRQLIEKGLQVSASTHEALKEKQGKLRKMIHETMSRQGLDFFISPAATSYPPVLSANYTGDPAMNIPWTFAGLPSISLPITTKNNHLPVGLQIVGKYGQDEILLAISARIARLI